MRALVQRVSSASVSVDGTPVGTLELDDGQQGIVALVGVTHTDTRETAIALANKVWLLRILDDQRSAADVGAPILAVSQFTLYADTAKGRRPSWSAAAPAAIAGPLVETFVEELRNRGALVETGTFGANMRVSLINDGPVTLLLEV